MATHTVVTGDRYMSIARKLRDLDRQLLCKSGYPHDLDMLEVAAQRLVDGSFYPNDDVRSEIEVAPRVRPNERLARLRLEGYEELCRELEGCAAPDRQGGAYSCRIGTARLKRTIAWRDIPGFLEENGTISASFEESCSFLEVNRSLQQTGALVCMDGFAQKDGKKLIVAFTGDTRRRFARVLCPTPDDVFNQNVRLLVRQAH